MGITKLLAENCVTLKGQLTGCLSALAGVLDRGLPSFPKNSISAHGSAGYRRCPNYPQRVIPFDGTGGGSLFFSQCYPPKEKEHCGCLHYACNQDNRGLYIHFNALVTILQDYYKRMCLIDAITATYERYAGGFPPPGGGKNMRPNGSVAA